MRCRRHHEQFFAGHSVWLIVVLASTVLSFPATTWGQQVTASITGKVADPSSGIIVGAKVTAKDLDRGTLLTTETNASGFYSLPRVPIGTYEIRVEVAGFQTAIHLPVHLELNQTARVDFVMQLGEVTQTVEVTGAAPLLQTDTMQLGSVINSKTNEDLPLATRNYIQLTLLAPGSVNPNPQTLTNGQTTANGGRPYVNGNREQANNFLLDGLDNNQVSDNLVGYAPSPDAIRRVQHDHQQCTSRLWKFSGRNCQHDDQVWHQPAPWQRLRILPKRCSQRQHLGRQLVWLAQAQGSLEYVWRISRRPDRERQTLLLW